MAGNDELGNDQLERAAGFLGRWSRRKADAKTGRTGDDDGRRPPVRKAGEGKTAHRPGRMITDAPSDKVAATRTAPDDISAHDVSAHDVSAHDPDAYADLEEMQRQVRSEPSDPFDIGASNLELSGDDFAEPGIDKVLAADSDNPERDLLNDDDAASEEAVAASNASAENEATAPPDWSAIDLDKLDGNSDYAPFMRDGVPEHIKNKALKKLWATNPIMARMDGLDDYCEDFSDAAWVAPNLRTSYKVGQGFLSDEEAAQWDALGKPDASDADAKVAAGASDSAGAAVAADGVSIAQEAPDQDEIAPLFAEAEHYFSALYPVDSNHFASLEELLAPNAHFFVARQEGKAIGCGAVIFSDDGWGELKRMWVESDARCGGIGRRLVAALEQAALAQNVTVLRLETGIHQDAALALYRRCGYRKVEPFGDYEADPLSVFMEKQLTVPAASGNAAG